MLSLLSNNAQLKRFLVYVALAPLVLRWVERAEDNGEDTGAEKRALVMDGCNRMFQALIGRGFIPIEATDNLQKTAGELIDMTVDVYNNVGFFGHGKEGAVPQRKKKAS